MAIISIATARELPERTREQLAEYEALQCGEERESLGAFRGLAFAVLIEAAMFLSGAVGWELIRRIFR